jgi:hypothetical protein
LNRSLMFRPIGLTLRAAPASLREGIPALVSWSFTHLTPSVEFENMAGGGERRAV